MIEPTLADARADPRANGDVGLQGDIVSDRERQLECLIKIQARQIEKLEDRIEEMEDHFGRRLAEAYARIAALEAFPEIRAETASDHLDRLFSEMRRLGLRQVSTTDASRLIGISKRQMAKVKPAISDDPRFALVVDPKIHQQKHLIRIV